MYKDKRKYTILYLKYFDFFLNLVYDINYIQSFKVDFTGNLLSIRPPEASTTFLKSLMNISRVSD